jgi:hypothetical protein
MGIFQRVRNQVADHLLEEATIASNGQCAGNHPQREARRLRVVCQLVPEVIKQLVHREVGFFRLYGSRFNLVDVQQGIQHSRHGAQSFVDSPDQLLGLLPDHLLG